MSHSLTALQEATTKLTMIHHDLPTEEMRGMDIMVITRERNLYTPIIRASDLKGQVLHELAPY